MLAFSGMALLFNVGITAAVPLFIIQWGGLEQSLFRDKNFTNIVQQCPAVHMHQNIAGQAHAAGRPAQPFFPVVVVFFCLIVALRPP